jgi:hypothetical protein
VLAIVDCPIGDALIVRSLGIVRKTGATLVPWLTDIDSSLKTARIFQTKWILGNYPAVLVENTGVYLLDPQGHVVQSLTLDNGLANAGFQARGEDRGGGLWVGTDTGITRVQFAVGHTEFDHELGLPKGFVTGVIRYQGKIHATTQYGVYVLKAAEDAPESPEFLRFGDESDRFFGITVSDPNAFDFVTGTTLFLDGGFAIRL